MCLLSSVKSEAEMVQSSSDGWKSRNLIAFWTFGVFNNVVYVVMLSAAQDIINKQETNQTTIENKEECLVDLTTRQCSPQSAGLVLLCAIFPCLIFKVINPFIAHKLPYGVRHSCVCLTQALALLLTACADSVSLALIGVMLMSFSGGLGETTYLGLASHYSKQTISSWSSGTGMAGIMGAFSYAALTDVHLMNLTSTQAMLLMLIGPVILFLTYYILLERPETIRTVRLSKPNTWIHTGKTSKYSVTSTAARNPSESESDSSQKLNKKDTSENKWPVVKSLLRYMVPLFLVYFAEYFINQGLIELTTFDCANSFESSPGAQYRWYQALYQVGVFISRSSINVVQLNMMGIALLPILQLLNVVFFFVNALYSFVPHFAVVAVMVVYEGLIGGAAYVNSFHHIHHKVSPNIREFALSTVSVADSVGITVAALTAIPMYNYVCYLPLY